MSCPYRFVNGELEDMSDHEFLTTIYRQFGFNKEPSFTDYENARLEMISELTTILRTFSELSPMFKRALYLAELHDRCLSVDMIEPLVPKIENGSMEAQA